MSQELIPANQQQAAPFGPGRNLPANVNAGAVSIEQERAIAEAQGQLILAKKFPRDLTSAHAELMTACKSPAFAAQAFYTVPNRGHGPSIRFAEEVARVYGNFQYGHRELSRDATKSEVEVFAWDMQNNNRSIRQITVLHVRDKGGSAVPLKDQTDIDNRVANVASKQMRGRILALMPKWLVAEAIDECKKTIEGNNTEPLEVRVRKMTQAFTRFGVTTSHLEAYLGHSLDKVLLDELVDLTGVFNALKEGTPASDFFGAAEKAEANDQAAASLADTAKAGAATQTKKPTAAKAAATPKEVKPEPSAEKSKPAEENSTPVKEAAPEVNDSDAVVEEEEEAVAPKDDPKSPVDIF